MLGTFRAFTVRTTRHLPLPNPVAHSTSLPRVIRDLKAEEGRLRAERELAEAILPWSPPTVGHEGQLVSAPNQTSGAERNIAADECPLTLPFAPLSDALANVPAEPEWTWKGYLAPGAITLIAGRPKVGKSTLLFGLLAALLSGELFLDAKTSMAGVLLLSEERHGTLEEKARRFGLKDSASLHLLMRHESRVPWAEAVQQAITYATSHGLGVLVVDTWDKWSGLRGDAENNAGDVIGAFEPLQRAAGQGFAVLVLSHQRKSRGDFGEAVRGSNALTGAVDIVLELERLPGDLGGRLRVLRAVSRYASTPEELVLELTPTGYEARGDSVSARGEHERELTREALVTLGAASSDQVAQETGLPGATARKRLAELVEVDEAVKQGEGKRGDPYRFSLSAQRDSRDAETNRKA